MRKIFTLTVTLCLIAGWVGCNSGSEKTPGTSTTAQPAQPKPSGYQTGRSAFQTMYITARQWAPDAKPFRIQSQYTAEAPTSAGKAGLWQASFASASKLSMKLFQWSGLVGPDAPEQGVSFSAEDSWNPSNSSTQVFELPFLKIDSDKAYEVAEKHGGEKLTTKDPKQPVFFLLDWDAPKSTLVWHVIYGQNRDKAKLRVAVNASTGEFLRIEK